MTNIIAACWALATIGIAVGGFGIWAIVRARALERTIEDLCDELAEKDAAEPGPVILTEIDREEELARDELVAIFQKWEASDPRWRALVQVIGEYARDAKWQAAQSEVAGSARKLAHANGAWLALEQLHSALWQLRNGREAARRGGRPPRPAKKEAA